ESSGGTRLAFRRNSCAIAPRVQAVVWDFGGILPGRTRLLLAMEQLDSSPHAAPPLVARRLERPLCRVGLRAVARCPSLPPLGRQSGRRGGSGAELAAMRQVFPDFRLLPANAVKQRADRATAGLPWAV